MNSASANLRDESSIPIPPRFRWTKRWLIFSARLLIALVLIWCAWSWFAAHQLQHQVDLILARHEPLYPADFPMLKVPGDQNAAMPLYRAGKAVSEDVPTPSLGNGLDKAGSAQWMRIADAALAVDGESLRLARKARAYKNGDWGQSPDFAHLDPLSAAPFFNPMRSLAQMLGDAALAAHFHGDDAEAIERFLDLLHAAEVFDQTPPNVIDWLVSGAMSGDGISKIEEAAPRIQVSNIKPTLSAPNQRPASRDQLLTLIRQLADESEQRQAAQRAVLGERMMNYNRNRQLRMFLSILGPVYDLAAAKQLIKDGYAVQPIQARSWVDSQSLWHGPPETPWKSTNRVPHAWIDDLTPLRIADFIEGYDREAPLQLVEVFWIQLAERRVAMTSLAMRLYVLDHHAWPEKLSDLVPNYLPALPIDPFDPDGKPIAYVILHASGPGQADRPLLFLKRPGPGTVTSPPLSESYGGQGPGAGFQWRDLSVWPPPQ
jgi:hypothetical protein